VTVVVVMGVAGCGKTTVARELAQRLGVPFADADEFHPPANIEKMSSGVPLTDADRWPWLRAIAHWIGERSGPGGGGGGVVTCSALRRRYRDELVAGGPVFFVHLHGDKELITRRVAERTDHFMPSSLVDSQFAVLEPLADDEQGVVIDITARPDALATEALDAFRSWECIT